MHAARTLIAGLVWIALAGSVCPAAAQFRPGRIAGTVKSDQGEPIRGAVVVARNNDATPPTISTVSDDKGRYGFLGLRSGVWTVLVRAPGFEPTSVTWAVRSGQLNGPPLDLMLIAIPGGAPTTTFDKVKAESVLADLEKASALVDAGMTGEAIAIYRSLVAKAPRLTSLHLAIARAYTAGKEPERAIEAYRTLLELEPSNTTARLELGLALADTGDAASAAGELERLVKEAPDTPAATAARAALQRLRG
jgi:tetratricopeptide (TPR) repeat protein